MCLFFTELLGDNDWTATYKSSNVCALRGSTLNFSCTYEYPYHEKHCYATALETLWFTKEDRNQPVDIGSDTDYEGRVEYSCHDHKHTRSRCYGTCNLRIKGVRQSDSAEYQFRTKITEQSEWGYTINHGVNLTVTGKRDNNIMLIRSKWELMMIIIPLEPFNVCNGYYNISH